MRVSILSAPGEEAATRATRVAVALGDAGHKVSVARSGGGLRGLYGVLRARPEVIHCCGAGASGVGRRASRLTGAAIVYEPMAAGDSVQPGAEQRPGRAVGRRALAVIARDESDAQGLSASLRLDHLPVLVGPLDGGAGDAARVLLALYDRLPDLNPTLRPPRKRQRARRLLGQVGRTIRMGALRHPLALAAYLRGRRERARGHPERAIISLQRALRTDPSNPSYGLQLAAAMRESDRRAEAAEELRALASRAERDQPRLMGEVGVELAQLGHEAEALAQVRALLANGTRGGEGSADALAWAARVQVELGDLAAAGELASRAAANAPPRWKERAEAALALERAGEPTAALELAVAAGVNEQRRRLSGLIRALDSHWAPSLSASEGASAIQRGRVLYLLESSLPHTPSGYAYRSRQLLRALREAGFEPEVATRLGFPASRGISDWAAIESVEGVVHHRFNLPGVRQYSGYPLDLRLQENAEQLLELVERTEAEIVIAATPQLNGVMALALREAAGTPVVYDVRGFPEMTWATRPGGAGSEIYQLRRTAETRCALEADAVITSSETMRQELTRRGIDAERVTIVPQVVDLEAYSPRPRPAELARSYGLGDAFVAGSISSLLDYEGIDLLLRALALARAEREELAVLVVGEGPARPSLEDLTRELGIEDAVTFTGRVDHARIPDHYALLDVFALPRRDLEVCRTVTPLKPFEALAMGVPLIASDLPALAEVVSASGAGRLVPPESPQALAATLLELAADRNALEELSARARKHALAGHDRAAARRALQSTIEATLNRS